MFDKFFLPMKTLKLYEKHFSLRFIQILMSLVGHWSSKSKSYKLFLDVNFIFTVFTNLVASEVVIVTIIRSVSNFQVSMYVKNVLLFKNIFFQY